VNAYVAYHVTYPNRDLRVRIVLDSQTPALDGVLPEALKERVESLAGILEKSAGIHLSVVGYMTVNATHGQGDPDNLRRFIEVRTPRADADILVAFWSPEQNDSRLGSAPPYSPVAVVRLDSGSPERDREVLLHQLLSLFGIPDSKDPKSVMNARPSSLEIDGTSRDLLMQVRLFDFSKGLAGMNRRMQSRILNALARQSVSAGATPRLLLADMIMQDGQPAAALEHYRSAVKSRPSDVQAHLGLARSLALTSRFAEAESEAREAVKLAPNSDGSLYELGYVLARAGKNEDAIAAFRRALAIAPKSARNHAGLGVAYFGTIGEFESATREFDVANQLDPSNPMLLADIDYVRRIQARTEREAEAAEVIVKAKPESGPARERLAMLLLRLGKIAPAMDQVREGLKLSPDRWQIHYILAVALYSSHDVKGAQAELEQAKKLGAGSRPRLEESIRSALAQGASTAN
jgi:Flp pilus assembly protein TadD